MWDPICHQTPSEHNSPVAACIDAQELYLTYICGMTLLLPVPPRTCSLPLHSLSAGSGAALTSQVCTRLSTTSGFSFTDLAPRPLVLSDGLFSLDITQLLVVGAQWLRRDSPPQGLTPVEGSLGFLGEGDAFPGCESARARHSPGHGTIFPFVSSHLCHHLDARVTSAELDSGEG